MPDLPTQPAVAVITGASSGIGKALATELARQGYDLGLCARNHAALQAVASLCQDEGVRVVTATLDVADADAVERFAEQIFTTFGRLDFWFNNAGVIMYGRFTQQTPTDFNRVIATNLLGLANGARAALHYFERQEYGLLVNIASGFGLLPAPFASSYVASKFAVRGLSASLRQEYGLRDSRIQVCTVLPATINTPVYNNAGNKTSRTVRAMPPVYSVDTVVRRILRLMRRPRAEVVIGRPSRVGAILFAAFPGLTASIFAKYVNRFGYESGYATTTTGNLARPLYDGSAQGGWTLRGHQRKSVNGGQHG